MAGNGLFRFLHPDDVAVLVLYHGAQAVLAPQLVFHHPLDAAFADGIADAVAGGILHRIGAAVLLEPAVLLGADGAGNAQHMGGQIAGEVGAHRHADAVHAGQAGTVFLDRGQQSVVDIDGEGVGVISGKFRKGHGVADPAQQPLLLLGVAEHLVLGAQRFDQFRIGSLRGAAVIAQPVQRFGVGKTLQLVAGAQAVQHVGIGVVVQVIQIPQPVQDILRTGVFAELQLAAQRPHRRLVIGEGIGGFGRKGQFIPPGAAVFPAEIGEGQQQGVQLQRAEVVAVDGDIADGGIAGKGLAVGVHDLPAGGGGLLYGGGAGSGLPGILLAVPQLKDHHLPDKKEKNGADQRPQHNVAQAFGRVHGRSAPFG